MGGAGTYAENLVKGLRQSGIEVFVISRGNQHDPTKSVFRVPSSNSPYWRRVFFMNPALSFFHELNKLHKFDLVHFNEPHVILERLKIPTVCTVHSNQINQVRMQLAGAETLKTAVDIRDFLFKGSVGSAFDVSTAHMVDKIVCPSPDLAQLVSSNCFVDPRKTVFIPNGIDVEAYGDAKSEDSEGYLAKFGLEKNNFILIVGRLEALKGIQIAIQAFKAICEDYPRLKMVIVGKGDFEDHLKYLARGVPRIVFTGYVSSLANRKMFYENSLFLAIPSFYEALPTVALEAMACSKAIVASNTGGIPFLVKNGRNGFLVKPGDSENLARSMSILCKDQKLRGQMGSLGRRNVERAFSIDHMVQETLNLYKSLVPIG